MFIKMENEDKLLNLFVDKTSLRPKLAKPFLNKYDNKVWASDGKILIIIDSNITNNQYESQLINTNNIFNIKSENCLYNIDINLLEECVKNVEHVFEIVPKGDCPECNGEGEVEYEYISNTDHTCYYVTSNCPICKGKGFVEEQKVQTSYGIINIGKAFFNSMYIDIIVKACRLLSIQNIALIHNDATKVNIFKINDNIKIILMPRTCDTGCEKFSKFDLNTTF